MTMGRKKKVGRPPKPRRERLVRLALYLSPATMDALERAAERDKRPVANMGRVLLEEALRARKV